MKKIILFLFFPAVLSAQTWTTHNVGSTDLVKHIDFTSADTGYVSLDQGTLRRTTNGSMNWSLVNTPVSVFTFDFLNSQYGFIGSQTSIYKTTNGGNTWTEVLHENLVEFYRIFVVDANTIFASGLFGDSLFLFKTANGGSSWTTVSVDQSYFFESAIYFQNPATGFYAASYSIKSTNNGGSSWSIPYYDPNWINLVVDIDFPNTDTGYALSYTSLLRSIDGGLNWNTTSIAGQDMYEQHFINGHTGFVCGGNGFTSGWVQQTTDAANTWIPIYTSPYTYDCLSFPADSVGYFGGDNGTVLKYAASPNGIAEVGPAPISMFPNPATSFLKIANTKAGNTVRIYSVHGQLIKELTTEESYTVIDLTGFSTGLYSVEIVGGTEVANGKLFIQ